MAATAAATRKGRPTAEDGRQKLAHILIVAREQFSELGYRAVTMRGVAEKAAVSTRTLYNRYEDKLSLFTACLESGSAEFPRPDRNANDSVEVVLRRYSADVAKMLSTDSALRLGMLVYREGGDFPELVRAANENQTRYLVEPLAAYLRGVGLEEAGMDARAKLFIAMALSEWQSRVAFLLPLPTPEEFEHHADLIVGIFLHGVRLS